MCDHIITNNILIIIKVSTDLFEKKNRMYHRSFFIYAIFKIATQLLKIGKYLRIVERKNNLKKRKRKYATQIKNILLKVRKVLAFI